MAKNGQYIINSKLNLHVVTTSIYRSKIPKTSQKSMTSGKLNDFGRHFQTYNMIDDLNVMNITTNIRKCFLKLV